MASPPPKKRDAVETPDVERHDEVYFRHAAGPKQGRVLSRGQHGCVIEADGKRHPVRWENFLGHKVRVRPDVKVVSHGEDGILVEAPHGGRRFVRDPMGVVDPPEEAPIRKSLRPVVVLFTTPEVLAKAMATGRPGLTLQDVTTKGGVRSKRWKKTSQDAPKGRKPAKPKPAAGDAPATSPAAEVKRHAKGSQVKFKIGALEGEGKVVGDPGKDGAHVEDASGHQHTVPWSQMREAAPVSSATGEGPAAFGDREPGEPDKAYAKRVVDKMDAPVKLPEEHAKYFNMDGAVVLPMDKLRSSKSDEENQQGGDNGPKRMLAAFHGHLGKRDPIKVTPNADGTFSILDGNGTFTGAKRYGWKAMPVMVVQPEDSEDAIFAGAAEANEHLATWLNKGKGVCDGLGFKTMATKPGDTPAPDWRSPQGMLFLAPLKRQKRSREKVASDYGGDWSRLKDVARCTIAVETLSGMRDLADHLRSSGMVEAQPPKDRYAPGAETGEGYRDINLVVRAPNGHLCEVQLNTKAMLQAKIEGHHYYDVQRKILEKNGDRSPEQWSDADNHDWWDALDQQRRIYAEAYSAIPDSPDKP